MKKVILYLIVGFTIFGVGFLVGKNFKSVQQSMSESNVSSNNKNTFEAGWKAAKKRLDQSQNSGCINLPSDVEIKDINGFIQKVDGDEIEVKIDPLEPLSDPDLDIRIVKLDKNLKIIQLISKDPQQLESEMQEFENKMDAFSKNASAVVSQESEVQIPTTPESYKEKEVSVTDLEKGQYIEVRSNENIKDKKEFVASYVKVHDNEIPLQ